MIEKEIAKRVAAHYATHGAPVLLLSDLGFQLKEAGIWPASGDTRSLRDAVAATPGVHIVQDPDARSFLAVVREGDEQRAREAIDKRHRLAFLRGLPRPVILAFTLEVPQGQAMHLQLTPRPSFVTGTEAVPDGFHLIDPELRMPGLDIEDLSALTLDQAGALEDRIRRWLSQHGIDPANLGSHRTSTAVQPAAASRREISALDRLLAAQEPDVARRMTVPLDIAVTLSRLH